MPGRATALLLASGVCLAGASTAEGQRCKDRTVIARCKNLDPVNQRLTPSGDCKKCVCPRGFITKNKNAIHARCCLPREWAAGPGP